MNAGDDDRGYRTDHQFAVMGGRQTPDRLHTDEYGRHEQADEANEPDPAQFRQDEQIHVVDRRSAALAVPGHTGTVGITADIRHKDILVRADAEGVICEMIIRAASVSACRSSLLDLIETSALRPTAIFMMGAPRPTTAIAISAMPIFLPVILWRSESSVVMMSSTP